jgi:SAM-dependent methyltransferase
VDPEQYRSSQNEQSRTEDLLALVPAHRQSVLEIGAWDGHFSRLLTRYFREVTALDLEKPAFEFPGVATVAGDVTELDFPDDSFDSVFCTEVLEHVPAVEQACREIIRVARHEIIIGVPFKQEIRLTRVTCHSCGRISPPWGHVNSFDEERLSELFGGLPVLSRTFVGAIREATNPVATFLMDLGGNPWGTYDQPGPCPHCGAKLIGPGKRTLPQKVASAVASRMNAIQSRFAAAHGNWIHVVFSKRPRGQSEAVHPATPPSMVA